MANSFEIRRYSVRYARSSGEGLQTHADDQLAVLDHLGIDQATVIGCSFIFQLVEQAPNRILAGVLGVSVEVAGLLPNVETIERWRDPDVAERAAASRARARYACADTNEELVCTLCGLSACWTQKRAGQRTTR
jgi:pimeloyl-ACP methyl ester carboxylesterase